MKDLNNVIAFPSKEIRDWAIIEKEIVAHCSRAMFPLETQKRLVEVMKAFWKTLDPNMNLSINVPFPVYIRSDDRDAISAAFAREISRESGEILKDFTNRLFVERFTREFQLCYDLGLVT